MKTHTILVFIISMMMASGFSTPLKGASEKNCAQCLSKAQLAKRDRDRARIKKEREDLKAENARLKAALENQKPEVVYQTAPRAVVTERTPSKKNRVSLLGGWGPQSVTNRRKAAGTEIKVENGPVVGAQYQRLFGETISLGVGATVPTYADTKHPTYHGSIGADF